MKPARSTGARSARVRALAKINLDLRVLDPRPDGFHELRTVFQTVSLADTLDISFAPARATEISAASSVEIQGGNIVERAARLVLDALGKTGRVEMRLTKRIPMGAGLGGGSSDAAAVVLALPVLAGKALSLPAMLEVAACLGSDVPFFLLGGTAVGMARGTEIYPLPDRAAAFGLIVAPGVHVATAEAYRDLDRKRGLTSGALQNIISIFQSYAWDSSAPLVSSGSNDFEAPVFERHPRLKLLKRQLGRFGANPAMLSGSGSALFGLFGSRQEAERAGRSFVKDEVFPIRLVTRRAYRSMWWRSLGVHEQSLWPPQSRHA